MSIETETVITFMEKLFDEKIGNIKEKFDDIKQSVSETQVGITTIIAQNAEQNGKIKTNGNDIKWLTWGVRLLFGILGINMLALVMLKLFKII